jgi:hypothetical protein
VEALVRFQGSDVVGAWDGVDCCGMGAADDADDDGADSLPVTAAGGDGSDGDADDVFGDGARVINVKDGIYPKGEKPR